MPAPAGSVLNAAPRMTPTARPATGVTLFVEPLTPHFERDRLFETTTQRHGGDTILEPYRYLREWMAARGVAVHTADALRRGDVRSATQLYVSLGSRRHYARMLRRHDVTPSAFLAMECPAVEPKLYRDLRDVSQVFRRVYTFSPVTALRPFLRRPMDLLPFHFPQAWDTVHDAIWEQEDRPGFLTIVNANKLPRDRTNELYTERLRAIDFFARTGDLDLYGVGWDQAPFRLGYTWVPGTVRRWTHRGRSRWLRRHPTAELAAARSVFRGAIADKAATLGRYRFALVIENMALDGWITEKIFDCLYTGTVPVYLGAPDVERWLSPDCYVDLRAFADYGALRDHLQSLSPADVRAYRDAGRAFLTSPGFAPFSKKAHAELFGRIVEEDAGVTLER
jgi:alpha(1,3/1,4) fucosyltransferase